MQDYNRFWQHDFALFESKERHFLKTITFSAFVATQIRSQEVDDCNFGPGIQQ